MFSAARFVTMGIGVWLLASAFLWDHVHAQFVNALATGGLCVAIATFGLVWPPARYGNLLLGCWLFLSTIVLPVVDGGTVLHNAIVAVLMVVFSIPPLAGRANRTDRAIGRPAKALPV